MSEEKKQEKKQDEKQEKEIPEKFKKIIQEIEKLNILELSQLVKVMEEKYDISPVAMAPTAGVSAGQEGGQGQSESEQTVFNVELTDAGDNKIGVIKALREIVQIGLKEAKDLVDNAPQIVKEGVSREEADEIKKKLEQAGAKVSLK